MISPQSWATVNLRACTLPVRRSISTSATIAAAAPHPRLRSGRGDGRGSPFSSKAMRSHISGPFPTSWDEVN